MFHVFSLKYNNTYTGVLQLNLFINKDMTTASEMLEMFQDKLFSPERMVSVLYSPNFEESYQGTYSYDEIYGGISFYGLKPTKIFDCRSDFS
ncbi:hypothetical protein [Aeromonas veronii]|uniref:hypothetical protein n=1 Tax=Aeromonas veronii TaxID=654 RepID=UPI003D1CE71B